MSELTRRGFLKALTAAAALAIVAPHAAVFEVAAAEPVVPAPELLLVPGWEAELLEWSVSAVDPLVAELFRPDDGLVLQRVDLLERGFFTWKAGFFEGGIVGRYAIRLRPSKPGGRKPRWGTVSMVESWPSGITSSTWSEGGPRTSLRMVVPPLERLP